MSVSVVLICIVVYFLVLLTIAKITSKNSTINTYFLGNKSSPWLVIAIGMLGDSLSGVTYISVPGKVYTDQLSYLQIVIGYFFGYIFISKVLLPIYYKLNVTSIYTYLRFRFGIEAQKTSALFFIISRVLGASARLYLAMKVIQLALFNAIDIPFEMSTAIIILLILIYTYKGGIKTLIWTDLFQSIFLILGVVFTIVAIINELHINITDIVNLHHHQVFYLEWQSKNFFLKDFLGGAFIAIAMTGLDQNMMQKNLSCKTLKDAQKNMFWFSIIMVIVNICFVILGLYVLYFYQSQNLKLPVSQITQKVITDALLPNLVFNHLGLYAGIFFICGLIAATFSSADSVLTTLTTSFYIDILNLNEKNLINENKKNKIRQLIHILLAILLWFIILIFNTINQLSIIDVVLLIAAYSYGPLLGLFLFGLYSKANLNSKLLPLICLISPFITYLVVNLGIHEFTIYRVGNELIIINASITIIGLLIIRKTNVNKT